MSEISKGRKKKEIKSRICKELEVKSRVADSAISDAEGIWNARKEKMKNEKTILETKIKNYKNKIQDLEEEYNQFREILKNFDWSKPYKGMIYQNRKYKFRIYQMKNKLNTLNQKLNNLEEKINKNKISIYVGSKKLLKYRHLLEEDTTKYSNLEEWITEWNYRRTRHIFMIGCTGDTYGSQLCKVIPYKNRSDFFRLKLNHYSKKVNRTYIECDIRIKYLEDKLKEVVESNKTISYNIVKETNGRYYLKPSIKIEPKEKIKIEDIKGCLGIDINNEFLSISLVDKSGVYKGSKDISFITFISIYKIYRKEYKTI